jgi:chorismate mutase
VSPGHGSAAHPESPELAQLRNRIEQTDRDIVDLVKRRVELALEAGRLKRLIGAPVFDPEREREVEHLVLDYAVQCGLDESHMRLVVRGLIALARSSQEREP